MQRAVDWPLERALDVIDEDRRRREADEPFTSKTILRLLVVAVGLSGIAFTVYRVFNVD